MNIRSTVYSGILYPDCDEHVLVLERFLKEEKCCCILHDLDIDDNGLLKKPHYHYVIIFHNARYYDAFCKDYNVPKHLVEPVRSKRGALRYLIHMDDHDKVPYPAQSVFGSAVDEFNMAIRDKVDESQAITRFLECIYARDSPLTFTDAIHIALQEGLYSAVRRMGPYAIRLLIDDFNLSLERI